MQYKHLKSFSPNARNAILAIWCPYQILEAREHPFTTRSGFVPIPNVALTLRSEMAMSMLTSQYGAEQFTAIAIASKCSFFLSVLLVGVQEGEAQFTPGNLSASLICWGGVIYEAL